MAAKYSVVSEREGIITGELLKNLTDVTENDGVYKDLIVAKSVAVAVLGIASFLIGLLPLQLAKWFKWNFHHGNRSNGNGNLVISLLLCFGGGVLMFTTFIHLQPEVREELDRLMDEGKAPHFEQLADLVFCAGFFFVYLIEEIVHGVIDRKHDHTKGETFFHRTVSLRGCKKGMDREVDPNPGIIPRVSLTQSNDGKSLEIDSSSAVRKSAPETDYHQDYSLKFSPLDPEPRLAAGGKFAGYSPYSKPDGDSMEKNSSRKNLYEKNLESGLEKGSPGIHSHSRGFFDDETNSSSFSSSTSGDSLHLANTFRGFFTVLALSFHAVFEGLAVGLENELSNVWYLFLAIATHKFVISFCVGVDLISTKTKRILVMVYLGTFAFVTPLGIGIGIGLSGDPTKSGSQVSTVILQGMAAGTLLYVVFFEVLQRERANNQSGILQLIAILAGFGVMFALQFVSGQHHHHHHHLDVSNLSSMESREHLEDGIRHYHRTVGDGHH